MESLISYNQLKIKIEKPDITESLVTSQELTIDQPANIQAPLMRVKEGRIEIFKDSSSFSGEQGGAAKVLFSDKDLKFETTEKKKKAIKNNSEGGKSRIIHHKKTTHVTAKIKPTCPRTSHRASHAVRLKPLYKEDIKPELPPERVNSIKKSKRCKMYREKEKEKKFRMQQENRELHMLNQLLQCQIRTLVREKVECQDRNKVLELKVKKLEKEKQDLAKKESLLTSPWKGLEDADPFPFETADTYEYSIDFMNIDNQDDSV